MNKEIRKSGYYWVNLKGFHDYWIIAQYVESRWIVTGEKQIYYDYDFEDIDERPIERQP